MPAGAFLLDVTGLRIRPYPERWQKGRYGTLEADQDTSCSSQGPSQDLRFGMTVLRPNRVWRGAVPFQ